MRLFCAAQASVVRGSMAVRFVANPAPTCATARRHYGQNQVCLTRASPCYSNMFGRSLSSAAQLKYSQQPPKSSRRPACDGDICRVGHSITDKIEDLADMKREQLANLKKNFSNKKLGDVTIGSTIGGMRGAKALICETSMLHPEKGILFRGYSIEELIAELPKPEGAEMPYVEGLLYLMLTGDLPGEKEVKMIQREMKERQHIPEHVTKVLEALPLSTHPMTQLVAVISACQTESLFAAKYGDGMPKTEYWKPCLDDAMAVIARVPIIASRIYKRSFKDGKYTEPRSDLDWAGNFAYMMGHDSPEVADMMRLYMLLHADHEGGNVSAHTAHLVGSALTDPYLSYAASMAGLAGPLHGLANQECLDWLLELQKALPEGVEPTKAMVKEYAQNTLKSGRVIPGYGHAVLRITDPRFTAQRNFALDRFPHDPLFKLLDLAYQTIPEVLSATGKVSNPYPNVDAHSGVVLTHYGITESSYFTVLFGVSRALGVLSQLVWSRIYHLPIERPGSVTLEKMMELAKKTPEAEKEPVKETS